MCCKGGGPDGRQNSRQKHQLFRNSRPDRQCDPSLSVQPLANVDVCAVNSVWLVLDAWL